MEFLLKTVSTMKPYNSGRYWVDSDMIRTIRVHAPDTITALRKYAEIVRKTTAVEISENAIKNRRGMYRDTATLPEQIGNVITAKLPIDGKEQYIDLWIEIIVISYPADLYANEIGGV